MYEPRPVPNELSRGARAFLDEELSRVSYWINLFMQTTGYIFKIASSVTLNNGTSSNTVSDLQTLNDGNEYHIIEAVGTPGQDLRINFESISAIKGVVLKAYYAGGSTHYVDVELYNYRTTNFDSVMTIGSGTTHNIRTILLPDGRDYFDGDGDAVIRIYHPVAGVASHDSYIEYVALLG